MRVRALRRVRLVRSVAGAWAHGGAADAGRRAGYPALRSGVRAAQPSEPALQVAL